MQYIISFIHILNFLVRNSCILHPLNLVSKYLEPCYHLSCASSNYSLLPFRFFFILLLVNSLHFLSHTHFQLFWLMQLFTYAYRAIIMQIFMYLAITLSCSQCFILLSHIPAIFHYNPLSNFSQFLSTPCSFHYFHSNTF